MDVLSARIVPLPDALAYPIRRDGQQFRALAWIVWRAARDAQRMAPLVPGDPSQQRFAGRAVGTEKLRVCLVDQHQSKLRCPDTERFVVGLRLSRTWDPVSGRSEQVGGYPAQGSVHYLPSRRTDMRQQLTVARRQRVPCQPDQLLCRCLADAGTR
jgi:hypothetical protein